MATYNYYCDTCAREATITQSISKERIIPKCPNCKKPMLTKFGVGAVKFRGTGWGKDGR